MTTSTVFPVPVTGLSAPEIVALTTLLPSLPNGTSVGTMVDPDDDGETVSFIQVLDGVPVVVACVVRLRGILTVLSFDPEPLGGCTGHYETVGEAARALRLYHGR